MAEQTILIAEDDPDIRDGVLDDVTNLISTAASLASYLLKIGANSTTGVVSSVLDYLSSGANYVCYVNGEQTTYKTSVKYPVLAGGISVRKTASGSVGTMAQLLPVTVDQLGAASVRSGSTRYETARRHAGVSVVQGQVLRHHPFPDQRRGLQPHRLVRCPRQCGGRKDPCSCGREKRLTASLTGCEMGRNPVIKRQLGDIFHDLSIEILPRG